MPHSFKGHYLARIIHEQNLEKLSAARVAGLDYSRVRVFPAFNNVPALKTTPLVYAMLSGADRAFELMLNSATRQDIEQDYPYISGVKSAQVRRGTMVDIAFSLLARRQPIAKTYLAQLRVHGAQDRFCRRQPQPFQG